jgi:hypothetical protein
MSNVPAYRRIDEPRLEADVGYRFNYVAEFMGFGPKDVRVIHSMAPHLAPLVPALVDAVYVKLFGYDATKRHFVPRQFGYRGAVPETLDTLSLDHEQIQFRKDHLGNYLRRLVTAEYDGRLVSYLDFVGKIHTPIAGSKEIDVPLVQMNALMGFVADALIGTIQGLPISDESKSDAIRAFSKLLWLQNDLISRHYIAKTNMMPTTAESRKPEFATAS